MIRDALLKLLQRCRRQWYKPDLHSFRAQIKDGVVFVECDWDGVDIDAFTYDKKGNEHRNFWRLGTALNDAIDVLEKLEINLDTVSM